MNKTQASRLLTLAYFLKTKVPRRKFDMGSYIHTRNDYGRSPVKSLKDFNCGTTGCAIGWCTAVFPSRFKIVADTFIMLDGRSTSFEQGDVQEFFGLDEKECFRLFSYGFVRTPKQEAEVIEEVVGSYGYVYDE